MVNHEALGRTGIPFDLDVDRGKIREFARATGSENPAYFADEDAVSPATFLATQLFWQGEGDANPWALLELDLRRVLHGEHEYTFYGPPPSAGERLTGTSTITDIYVKQGRRGGEMTFVVMTTQFRDASGRLVAEAKMTGVETARPPSEDGASVAASF